MYLCVNMLLNDDGICVSMNELYNCIFIIMYCVWMMPCIYENCKYAWNILRPHVTSYGFLGIFTTKEVVVDFYPKFFIISNMIHGYDFLLYMFRVVLRDLLVSCTTGDCDMESVLYHVLRHVSNGYWLWQWKCPF